MKKSVVTFMGLLFLLSVTASQVISGEVRHKTFNEQEIKAMQMTNAVIHTKFGDMSLKFFPEVAPNHVSNFIELAKKGFYNGTTFHRVIPGFMIQGGDPNSKNPDKSKHGTGGPGYQLKAEFNDKSHKKGILSMARSGHPDSAGSQFFICVADAPHLDGKYTVFGEVIKGTEVADKIVSQEKDRRNNPLERIEMKVEIVPIKTEGASEESVKKE
ncbi:peptidylprolyl isomerase [Desulfonema magnum]|uniref:Peptidyl-prolyl cis-trans isomerase n=1 Tax=Desulfonema magnum TaxID=45655 RepID=A0A975BT76_9BACT|nr:peptidylprolyl isomerase [Desulfonema magnum]QTA91231.1 Peptidyl-prolyl cis-trans isomerase A [Desulfonema magnum]